MHKPRSQCRHGRNAGHKTPPRTAAEQVFSPARSAVLGAILATRRRRGRRLERRQGTAAHRYDDDREVIDVLEALVVSVDRKEGLPVLKLRSLNGQPMLEGDSGGGVWLEGKNEKATQL